MDFNTRNADWNGTKERVFVQSETRSSSYREWRIKVKGPVITVTWGQQGGKMQTQGETAIAVNVGKKNEVSPEEYALYLARDKCRKKRWEGYREVNANGDYLDPLITEIDFDNLPLNLAFYKPANNIFECSGLLKKADGRKVWYTRKRDGNAMVLARGQKPVRMYSRRMLTQHDKEQNTAYTWNDRFQYIVDAAQKVMPPNSIVLGELVMDRNGVDEPARADSYIKSLTPQCCEDMAKFGYPVFYVWDIAFWDGVPLVQEAPVRERYALINSTFGTMPFLPIQVVTPGEFPGFETPLEMRQLAVQFKWEGWVVVDPDGCYGDRAFTFKGKPDRPSKYCGKLKPEFEDDFIVYWDPAKGYGEYSTKGRYGGQGMKSATLWQLNKKGEMVYISNVASGLTEEMKTDVHPTNFPQVWKVAYSARRYISAGDPTNSLDFPRFISTRTDKLPEECVDERL
jgi:predicted DNA-binding WGR domain protein